MRRRWARVALESSFFAGLPWSITKSFSQGPFRLRRRLWRVQEASPLLYDICQMNPFTHATELIRFALYAKISWTALAVVCGFLAVFMVGAIMAYDPSRGFIARRGGPGGET